MSVDLSKAKKIRGWMGIRELQWLAAKASENLVIVEVGTFAGRSARAMVDNLIPGGFIICVDSLDPRLPGLSRIPEGGEVTTIGEGNLIYAELRDNLRDHLNKKIAIWRMTSAAAASIVEYPMDFIFLDGDHSRAGVEADIVAWLPHVRSGGTLAGHDYYTVEQHHHPGVREAVDAAFGTELVRHPVGSIWTWEVPE